MQNTIYAYPDTWVCIYSTYGCDGIDLEPECLRSATMTEGGNASAVFYPGGEFEQEVPGVANLTHSVSMQVFLFHAWRAHRLTSSSPFSIDFVQTTTMAIGSSG